MDTGEQSTTPTSSISDARGDQPMEPAHPESTSLPVDSSQIPTEPPPPTQNAASPPPPPPPPPLMLSVTGLGRPQVSAIAPHPPPSPPPLSPDDPRNDRVPYESPLPRRHRSRKYSDPPCIVCLDETRNVRPCCRKSVCFSCMVQIVNLSINDGSVHINCPNPECNKPVSRIEVIQCIGGNMELKEKYERFSVNAGEGNRNKKTCPNCSLITEHNVPRKFSLKEEDVKVTCASCALEWCFKCHAPWHAGLTCRAFKKGDKQFREWTKGTRTETMDANCRQCPTCRVYIQRNQGCDHMTCSRCGFEFCYKCGGPYPWVPIPGMGDHHSKLGVFGCPYKYEGNSAERKVVRGGYLAAKCAALVGYPFLFAGGVALLLGVGLVAVPAFVGYRLYRYHKNTRKYQIRRRRH